jgi:hypothetical protein
LQGLLNIGATYPAGHGVELDLSSLNFRVLPSGGAFLTGDIRIGLVLSDAAGTPLTPAVLELCRVKFDGTSTTSFSGTAGSAYFTLEQWHTLMDPYLTGQYTTFCNITVWNTSNGPLYLTAYSNPVVGVVA